MYTQGQYKRDVRRVWKRAKPLIVDGTVTPFVAAFNPKKRGRAIVGLLTIVPTSLHLLCSLVFFSARLALKK